MPEYRNIPFNTACYSEVASTGERTLCVTPDEMVLCSAASSLGYLVKCAVVKQRKGAIFCYPYHKEGRSIYFHYNGLKTVYKELIKLKLCEGIEPEIYIQRQDEIKRDNKLRNVCTGLPSMLEFKREEETVLNESGLLTSETVSQITRASAWCRLWRKMDARTAHTIGFKSVTEVQKAMFELCMEEQKKGFVRFPKPINSIRVLDRKAREYSDKGLPALVSGQYGNTVRRKVSNEIENILLYLFADDKKPYYTDVHQQFQAFMDGYFDIINKDTGEIYEPSNFVEPCGLNKGEPLSLGVSTVRSWIQKPENFEAVMKLRQSRLENINRRPHVKRHAPNYSLSKITMDDISLPFKMANGNRPWSYQAFDVASTACVGYTFDREGKEGILFEKCMRSLFMMIVQNGWGMPGQVEIERHLTTHYKGREDKEGEFVSDILTPGALFPFVHFCLGANPREKRAEGFIKQKKYQFQRKRDGFQRRPFAKSEANRMNEDTNNVRYTYDEIIENEIADINSYNNALHPDQDMYPGMSRWEVLVNNLNPNLQPANHAVIARHVGYSDDSRINNSQYVMANNREYVLPSVDVADKLRVSRDKIKVYWLNDSEVYLYYKDKYLGTCKEWKAFNEALCEQTVEDKEIFSEQMKFLSHYDKRNRDKIAIIKSMTSSDDNRTAIITEQKERKKRVKEEQKELALAETAQRQDFFRKKGIDFSVFK